jgi:hypothetical protein
MTQVAPEPADAPSLGPAERTPPRRRSGLLTIGSYALIVALAAAAAAVTDFRFWSTPTASVAAKTVASPTVSSAAVATTPPRPDFDGDLRSLLLPRPRSAKAQLSDHESTEGNVSLDQATKVFGDTDLRAFGFKRGATTGWSDTKGYVVFIDLYQMDTDDHATDFLSATQRAVADSSDLESTAYFDGITNARWFIDKKKPGIKQQMYALFRRGPMWTLIGVYCPTKPDISVLTALVNEQYGRLPST